MTLAAFVLGFSSILTGVNFIVDGPQAARAGDGLVPAAAVRLGRCTPPRDPDPGDAGARDHAAAADHGARVPRRHLRPEARRRPGSVPALLLVLLAPGRVHHDRARHARASREIIPVFSQKDDFRLQGHRVFVASRSQSSASWSGGTTCSSAASRPSPVRSSRS